MQIETARPTDVGRIVALVNDAYRGSSKTPGWTHETKLLAGQRIDAAAVIAMIEQPNSTVLVMRQEGDHASSCAHSLGLGIELKRGNWSLIGDHEHGVPALMLASGRSSSTVSSVATTRLIIPVDGEWLYKRVPHREQKHRTAPIAGTSNLASSSLPTSRLNLTNGMNDTVANGAP